jgi:putative DNA primase/helicase
VPTANGPALVTPPWETVGDSAPTAPDSGPPPPPDDDDGPGQPEHDEFRFTDQGNGKLMATLHGYRIRYCYPWSKWLVWDSRRWRIDDTGMIRRVAKDVTRWMAADAALCGEEKLFKLLLGWAKQTSEKGRTSNMIDMCQSEPGIPILPDQLDRDPWLFNCRNGTLDLRTGTLRPHSKLDHITKLCDLDYDPDARAPLWLSTLDLFLAGDQALIDYFQEIVGAALSGEIRDAILPVCYGTGNNGKSTILEALIEVFGPDYAMKCPPDLLMAKTHETHPTERADLFGKRLVIAIETEEGRRLNETMVKELTGRDSIRARRMREDFWQFKPTHSLIAATNHKPIIRGTDYAIWRRLKLLPFLVAVAGTQDDKTMPAKLRAEYPGILAWCVRGCLRWQRSGLTEPACVSEATEVYRAEQDVLGTFLADKTITKKGAKVQCGYLYATYKLWAENASEYAKSLTAFGMAMQERGIVKTRTGGVKYYLNIELRVNEAVNCEQESR